MNKQLSEEKVEEKKVFKWCLRCGMSRKDVQRYGAGCKVYGVFFKRHLWTAKKEEIPSIEQSKVSDLKEQLNKSKEEFEEKFEEAIGYACRYAGEKEIQVEVYNWHTQQQITLLKAIKKWAEENKKAINNIPELDLRKDNSTEQLWKIAENNRNIGHNQALQDLISEIDKNIKEYE